MPVPLLDPGAVLVLCGVILFAVGVYMAAHSPDRPNSTERRQGADLDLDHRLGAHRAIPSLYCARCRKGEA